MTTNPEKRLDEDRDVESGITPAAKEHGQSDPSLASGSGQLEKEEEAGSPGAIGASTLSRVATQQSTKSTLNAHEMPLWREVGFVTVASSAQFLTQFGFSICLPILHKIGRHFDIDDQPGELAWLLAAYSLTVGTFILPAGRLGDVFGYRRLLFVGFAWLAVWSAVGGAAYYANHVLFDFARVLQGVGPALLLTNGLAVLGATYHAASPARRTLVFSLFGAMAPTGSIVGAVVAGALDLVFWPWAFWVLAMLAALGGLGTWLFVPDPPRRVSSRSADGRSFSWAHFNELASKLDVLGAVVGIAGLVLFNFSWNQAGLVGWTSEPYVWVTLILSALFLAAFFVIEIKFSAYPLIPFDAMTSDVAYVLGCIACGWACFGIWIFYMWQFFLTIRNASPLLSAVWALPLIPSGIIAALTTGQLVRMRVRPGWIMLCAMTAFCVGVILISTAPPGQIYWAQTFVSLLVIAWGMDMSFPSASLILSSAVAKEHQGVGSSLLNTLVNYSISISLGVAGTIEAQVANGDVLKGYRSAWYFAIGTSGLGIFLASLFVLKSYRQDRK